MLLNHLTITLRQLMKNKTFTFINVSGLTLGFLCFMLLALYINDELRFDMFHRDAEKIYRVIQHEQQEDGTIRNVAQVACLIGKETVAQIPDVEAACRISFFGRVSLGNDPPTRDYQRIVSTDANFFL